jgi:hypothetical protein
VAVTGLPGRFTDLQDALTAAADGATVTLYGSRPFRTAPLRLGGKALTLRGAPGVRPCLESVPGPSWDALLESDRNLTLDGIDLCAPQPADGRPLVCVEGAVLRLRGCRLSSAHREPLVLLRQATAVRLTDCRLDAGAVAVSVEVGARSCRIDVKKCRLQVRDASGAALSLWAGEEEPAFPVEVELAGNICSCGRVLALRAVPGPVRVRAADNAFQFRDALISYDGYRDPAAARRGTIWQEGVNRHQVRAPGVGVSGRPLPGPALR